MAVEHFPTVTRASGLIVPGIDAAEEARKIVDRIGKDLVDAMIFGNRILVAKWIRDKVGSLVASSKTQTEDKWQGKTGLVLALGPAAFVDDAQVSFYGDRVEVGDWALFSYNDGRDVDFQPPGSHEKIACKILRDVDIDGKVPRPDMFY